MLSAIGAIPGTAAGVTITAQREENSVPQFRVYWKPASLARAPRLPPRIWPVWLTRAQWRIDPPIADAFPLAVRAAHLVRQALAEAGLVGAVKTSGAKGVHVFVPIEAPTTIDEVAAATRALAARAERLDPALATTAFIRDDRAGKVFLDSTRAGGATVVAAYSPRVRPGVPVSFPVAWDELDRVAPGDFTVHTAARLIVDGDSWADRMPTPQQLSSDLIEEGRAIPVARVQAMHEGKRRARARRD